MIVESPRSVHGDSRGQEKNFPCYDVAHRTRKSGPLPTSHHARRPMKNKTSIAVLLVICTLTVVSTATAQTPKRSSGFVDVNIGAQPQSRTIDSSTSFP